MRYRLLGQRTGLQVSEMALGTFRLGTPRGGQTDREAARDTLSAYSGAGGNFIDTSSAYLFGLAEEMVGDFLAEAGRDRFVVASKYGRTAERAPAPAQVGNHRVALVAEVENSLRRLRTDRIDLYFPHSDDGVTPIEEIMRGLDTLVRAGKIVHIGLSNFPAWRTASAAMLADLRGWAPVAALQLQYNVLERGIEREHAPMAQRLGLGLMAWSPLAGGRLVRAIGEEPELTTLRALAGELDASPDQIALAWLRGKGVFPVLGARDAAQLSANLTTSRVVLDPGQIARIDAASTLSLGFPYDLLREQQARPDLA